MTKIKRTEESPQAVPVERPAETASPAESAHSPVERVTEKKAKDPKQVATGHEGVTARQKQLLEQLQAAKESLRAPVSADDDGTSAPPKEAKPPKRTEERPKHNNNCISWIIKACLVGVHLRISARGYMRLRASPTSVAAGPRPKSRISPPQLKACPDPHYME